MVEIDGEPVQPAALAAELRARPGVAEAAVLAVPDPRLGARLVAFVANADASAPPLLLPARVVTLQSLPHAPDGSIDYQALQRMASAE
jgi:acyl-CoA synthetase (AMP-forming)/AMP-acid ligase II